MNMIHRWICNSAGWKRVVKNRILPWTLEGVELGDEVLEVGPGPGATTDLLRNRVRHLTCVEIDRRLAESLARRYAEGTVRVLHEDATSMSLPAESFDGAVCFTMLHHVPSAELQDRLLREVSRVLRPGGWFVGTDSLYSRLFGLLHLFDIMVIVDPRTFQRRLEAAGFGDIQIDVLPRRAFRFRARRLSN